jgi:transposase
MSLKTKSNQEVGMYYLGIDVGKKSSTYFATDGTGARVAKGVIASSPEAAAALVRELEQLEGVEVAIEAGNVTFTLVRAMEEVGADVFVIHPRDNAIIALSRRKTDGIDAKMLAEQRRLGILPSNSVFVPTEALEDLRHLVATREALVTKRTAATNQVLHVLARYSRFPAKRVYKSDKAWLALLDSLVELRTADRLIIESHGRCALLLNEKVKLLEKQICLVVKQDFEFERSLLQSVPGIGPVTISSIIAWAHPLDRFGSARHFASYAGLTPSVRNSGARSITGGTSRSGNPHLGRNFVQAALGFVRTADKAHELYTWYDKVRRKRGWKKARVALGRKLACVAYGVLSHARPYDPTHVAKTHQEAGD